MAPDRLHSFHLSSQVNHPCCLVATTVLAVISRFHVKKRHVHFKFLALLGHLKACGTPMRESADRTMCSEGLAATTPCIQDLIRASVEALILFSLDGRGAHSS